jgi:drug/metabolite transporter (DMT)-like permease
MTTSTGSANYRLGAVYSVMTAALLAVQEPFSALAARSLSSSYFVGFTQIALVSSVPLLIARRDSRRDFVALLSDAGNIAKLAILLLIGIAGLLLYNIGLSSAHPIITAGVLNLSPFWAALVALVISRKSFPASPPIFFGCFIVAFIGAMTIAWSQIETSNSVLVQGVLESITHSRWIWALPMPLFFALSGTLVFKWFSRFDEGAAIAANFIVSGAVLIPATLVMSKMSQTTFVSESSAIAILLLILGTLASSAAGRVFYQIALTETDNDNGFVTMFFLLIPVISSLISIPLSKWIPSLRMEIGPLFFIGMALVTLPLLVFSLKSLGTAPPPESSPAEAR